MDTVGKRGHVYRMRDDRLLKIVMPERVEGQRRPGRTRTEID